MAQFFADNESEFGVRDTGPGFDAVGRHCRRGCSGPSIIKSNDADVIEFGFVDLAALPPELGYGNYRILPNTTLHFEAVALLEVNAPVCELGGINVEPYKPVT